MKKLLACGMCMLSLHVLAAEKPYFAKPAHDTFIAHRGESGEAPENTMPAFQLAVSRGFGFECDLYLSADKRVFAFHDKNLKRTTGKDLPCHAADWETTLSKLDAGSWKGPEWKGIRPALLEEILTLARDGRRIYLEIKSGPQIVPYIKAILEKQKQATPENALFICFSKDVCRALKKHMPQYKVYWLVGSHRKDAQGRRTAWTAKEIVDQLAELGVNGVDIAFDPVVHDKAFVKTVRDAGYEFHVWTIDKLPRSLQAFAAGAQTVTTNYAKKQLDAYSKK